MNIIDAYKRYNIVPFLQLHQLRVGAVALTLCEDLNPSDTHEIVSAALLHDMGNLLKFDLNVFPKVWEPEGTEFWSTIKRDMQARYGTDEHKATVAIARELGVSERTLHIIDHVGYGHIPMLVAEDDLGAMIAEYADLCVAPHGIVTMEERLEEGRKRYADKITKTDPVWHALLQASVPKLQRRVFRDATISPEDITEAALASRVETLRHWII